MLKLNIIKHIRDLFKPVPKHKPQTRFEYYSELFRTAKIAGNEELAATCMKELLKPHARTI